MTYHDLNTRQLRGYFTWRTQVRKGNYQPTSASFAYLYLYEMLNGIGTTSPEELVRKGFAYGVLDVKDMRQRVLSWKKFGGNQHET